jgi:hypothetical protein
VGSSPEDSPVVCRRWFNHEETLPIRVYVP